MTALRVRTSPPVPVVGYIKVRARNDDDDVHQPPEQQLQAGADDARRNNSAAACPVSLFPSRHTNGGGCGARVKKHRTDEADRENSNNGGKGRREEEEYLSSRDSPLRKEERFAARELDPAVVPTNIRKVWYAQ